MLPTCLRQLGNSQLRFAGLVPVRTYHTQVGPGDIVRVHIVCSEPEFSEERFSVRVAGVDDHGYYLDVHYERLDGEPGGLDVARLFKAGPPDWGVIGFRIIEKVHRPLPPDMKHRI